MYPTMPTHMYEYNADSDNEAHADLTFPTYSHFAPACNENSSYYGWSIIPPIPTPGPFINLPEGTETVNVEIPTLVWRYYTPESFADVHYGQNIEDVEEPEEMEPETVEVNLPVPNETPASTPIEALPVPTDTLILSASSKHWLKAPIEYQAIAETLIDSNLRNKMNTRTDGYEKIIIPTLGDVISSNIVRLVVNPAHHPLLFHSIPAAPDSDGIKYIRVHYANCFKRIIRTSKFEGWDVSWKTGRPSRSIEWHHYQPGGSGDCFSCGRQFGSRRGKDNHLNKNRGERESCEVVYLQRCRDRCYFCDEPIKPTDDASIIEQHTKVCGPLWELKLLVNKYHLEDSGLRHEEIKAFQWPVRCACT
jgi:hypothetical protein